MAIETSALESVSPLEEDPYEQFKSKEAERLKPPPVQAAADDKTPSDAAPKVAEPAGEPEAPPKTTSEEKPKQPTRKRDAESTIAEKTREIKERDEKIARLEREHAEEVARLRSEASQPKREAPPQDTRPAADQPTDTGLMKRSAFREKYAAAHPDATYNDIDDAYDEYRDGWREEQRRQAETTLRLQAKELESAKAHTDYHSVVTREAANRVVQTLAQPAVIALRDETDNPTELLYHLLQNPNELMRIARLRPMAQVGEVFKLSASLAKPSEATAPPAATPPVIPQMPTRVTPITRVTPPPKHVLTGGGASPVEGPDSQDPSFDNWKKAEQRRTGKRA